MYLPVSEHTTKQAGSRTSDTPEFNQRLSDAARPNQILPDKPDPLLLNLTIQIPNEKRYPSHRNKHTSPHFASVLRTSLHLCDPLLLPDSILVCLALALSLSHIKSLDQPSTAPFLPHGASSGVVDDYIIKPSNGHYHILFPPVTSQKVATS